MELETLNTNEQWAYVLSFLPGDLDTSARVYKAFDRKRAIGSAEELLRILLTYAVTDFSLQSTCAWMVSVGMGHMSKPALFYRVRDAEPWLLYLLSSVVNPRQDSAKEGGEELKVKVVDATCLSGPGATGTEWRIHVRVGVEADGRRWAIEGLQITDEHVGESYRLHELGAGDLVIGDGGYGVARGMYDAREREAHMITRISSANIRVCDLSKVVIKIADFEPQVPEHGVFSTRVLIPVPPEQRTKSHQPWALEQASGWIKARLLGCRTKKGEVMWLVTTVAADLLDDEAVLRLYRIRWQIELLFKRLKSLAWLDRLPAPHQGPTAVSWIAARLLAAALVEKLNASANDSVPVEPSEEPSVWREFHVGLWAIRTLFVGNLFTFFLSIEARKATYSSPRKRRLQRCPPRIPPIGALT